MDALRAPARHIARRQQEKATPTRQRRNLVEQDAPWTAGEAIVPKHNARPARQTGNSVQQRRILYPFISKQP